MKAVSIAGYKNSGKTGLAINLAKHIKKFGLSVGYLKFSSHGFDKVDSDTQKLSSITDKVGGISDQGSFVFWPGKSLVDLLPLLQSEFLIIEGGKDINFLPRIVIPTSIQEYSELSLGLALAAWGNYPDSGIDCVSDISSVFQLIQEKGFILPGLNCGACNRENCYDLALEIVDGVADITECNALNSELSITVNGNEIPMNPFVRSLITGTLEGMLSRLKGYTPGEVKIQLET